MKFADRLKELGFSSYEDYLRSDHWSGFREKYRLSGARMTCLVCNAKPIQLHHHTYSRLGKEYLEDVDPLCREHHIAVHDWLKSSGKIFVKYTKEAIKAIGGTIGQSARQTKRQSKKQRRRAKAEAKQKAALERRLVYETSEEREGRLQVPELVDKLMSHNISKKQRRRVKQWERDKDYKQLRGLLGCIEKNQQPKSKKTSKKQGHKPYKEDKSPGSRFNKNRIYDWSNPLQAIRMLGNGHQLPPYRPPLAKTP
jgi:hypothetical protein